MSTLSTSAGVREQRTSKGRRRPGSTAAVPVARPPLPVRRSPSAAPALSVYVAVTPEPCTSAAPCSPRDRRGGDPEARCHRRGASRFRARGDGHVDGDGKRVGRGAGSGERLTAPRLCHRRALTVGCEPSPPTSTTHRTATAGSGGHRMAPSVGARPTPRSPSAAPRPPLRPSPSTWPSPLSLARLPLPALLGIAEAVIRRRGATVGGRLGSGLGGDGHVDGDGKRVGRGAGSGERLTAPRSCRRRALIMGCEPPPPTSTTHRTATAGSGGHRMAWSVGARPTARSLRSRFCNSCEALSGG